MVLLLIACTVMAMGEHPRVHVGVTIPLLPGLVVMEREPYYYHQGYHYHYKSDQWYYSKSKNGPWKDLPRSHWAKEVKYKKEHWKYANDRKHYQRNNIYDDKKEGKDKGKSKGKGKGKK